jgi:hypothetical protein
MPLVELHHSIHAPGSPCSLFQIEHNLLIIIAESPQNRNEGSPHPANAGYFPSLALGPIEEHLAMCAGSLF